MTWEEFKVFAVEAVAAGAALLDRRAPGWRSRRRGRSGGHDRCVHPSA